MLNSTRHCTCCGKEMTIRRSTKAFCSEACRKKAARGGTTLEQQIESRRIVECLRRLGLISRIWPVYSWDPSPTIFALMVTIQGALDELNLNVREAEVTEGELERALRDRGIETSSASDTLRAEIKAFYDARKERRIGKGYTPSDKGNSEP
jgi:hypothetical protein